MSGPLILNLILPASQPVSHAKFNTDCKEIHINSIACPHNCRSIVLLLGYLHNASIQAIYFYELSQKLEA